MPISQRENDLAKAIEAAAECRDRLHNLDLNNKDQQKFYKQQLQGFLVGNEARSKHAYDDGDPKRRSIKEGRKVEGNITIGIGFNMERDEAEEEWNKAFRGTISFDDAKDGKINLTDEQIQTLFDSGVEMRVELLRKIYKSAWGKLRANEQLAILDAYFNGPGVVKGSTKFYRHIVAYVETGDRNHLENALDELEHRSNPEGMAGLAKRRKVQAELLNSTKAPLYTRPGESQFPAFVSIAVTPGKTIIPRGMREKYGDHPDKRYYVWRTQMDHKVREAHAILEGKVFSVEDLTSIGHPGSGYNCRCEAEPLPMTAHIVEETLEIKHMRLIILEIGSMIADWRALHKELLMIEEPAGLLWA